MTNTTAEVPFDMKKVLPWCLWDVGSAGINAVATTFVFSVYLTSSAFGSPNHTNSVVSSGLMWAGIIVALTAPITGQRADRRGHGVRWLAFFSMLIVVALVGMVCIKPDPGYLLPGVILLAIGTIGNEYSNVNYFALLPRIANSQNMGRISGAGWASGYFGGIFLLLFLNYGFIADNHFIPIPDGPGWGVRIAMAVAALWSFGFFLPVLFTAPKSDVVDDGTIESVSIWQNYKNLWHTIKTLYEKAPHTLYFLIASAIFRDGLTGVFTFGGIIAAATFGFTPGEVLIFGVAANIVAGIATISLGRVEDIIGPKRLIIISLVCLVVASVAVFALHSYGPVVFWTFGLFLCIWVGPAQSASRSFLARRVPKGNENEIFGLYQTTGRAATPLAPALYGGAIAMGAVITGSNETTYFGILGVAVVLLIGLVLLIPVNDKEARLDHITH